MKKVIFVSMLVSLAVVLAACGSSAAPASAPASASQGSIKVETNPSPAVVGDVELILAITDANGNPLEGATVNVSADHPSMAGMGMSGLATEQGGGKYSIKANFSDPGDWKLSVQVTKDSLDFKEETDFPIQ
jgi:hypothetical protein